MSLAAGVPVAKLGGIVTGGAVALAPVYVAVVFGALLGRVTIETGIARTIVNLAAEYGGEQPFALALGLCAIVALLFTSLSGLGGIIMVGSIVLPIMMTAGVPRAIAATTFLMGFALGFIFNIANWTFYTKYFGVGPQQLVRYAIVLAILDAVALVVYAAVAFRRERGYATWAVAAPSDRTRARVPAIALLTPVLPLLLYYALHFDAAPAFIVAAVFGVLDTRPDRAVQRLVAAAIRGVEDVAPAVLLFMGIGMLLVATQQPQFADALRPLVAGGWLRNPVAYVAALRRGEPARALSRTAQSVRRRDRHLHRAVDGARTPADRARRRDHGRRASAKRLRSDQHRQRLDRQFHGRADRHDHETHAAVSDECRDRGDAGGVLASPALFGVRAFASAVRPASAQEALPGFYAPRQARGVVAVDDDGSPLGRAAADAAAVALGGGLVACAPAARGSQRKRLRAEAIRGLRSGYDIDVRADRGRRRGCRFAARRLRRLDRQRVARSRGRRAAAARGRGARLSAAGRGAHASLGERRTDPQRRTSFKPASPRRPAHRPRTFMLSSRAATATCAHTFAPAARPTAPGCAPATSSRRSTAWTGGDTARIKRNSAPTTERPHVFEVQRDGRPLEIRLAAPFVLRGTRLMDSTTRFGSRANAYAAFRPSYPTEAIDAALAGLSDRHTITIADVGAGTGISARLFAERGVRVIAIEPNARMRAKAEPHPGIDGATARPSARIWPTRASTPWSRVKPSTGLRHPRR